MSTKEDFMEEENMIDNDKRNVVITGFGLFRDHQMNPSWEAIKDGQLKINRPDINIITEQINVAYDEVDRIVPSLWRRYNPILMIHVGLAAHDPTIRIEQIARHGPYIHDDVCNKAPHEDLRVYESECCEENIITHKYSCKPCNFESKSTCLDVGKVCDKLNEAFNDGLIPMESRTSKDAGLYVCEYIYHTSLKICDRCVFIHVPDTTNYNLTDIRKALQIAIEALLCQIEEKCH